MEVKYILDYIDIMNRFNCCESKARGIIRAIKTVSDIAKLAGRVTETDFQAWYTSPLKKEDNATVGSSLSSQDALSKTSY